MTKALTLTYTPVPGAGITRFVELSHVAIDGVIQKRKTRDVRANRRYVVAINSMGMWSDTSRLTVVLRTYHVDTYQVMCIGEMVPRDIEYGSHIDSEFEPLPWDTLFYLDAYRRQFAF